MYYFKLVSAALLLMVSWVLFVFTTAFYGWWMSPIADSGDSEAFFQRATEMLVAENRGNAALVLIEGEEVVGEYFSTINETIDRDTVFSTASMSKWLTASGVMNLVQDGRLDLDQPVSAYLTRWQLPPSQFDNYSVTARHLLSHTAGLNDGLGFGDYTADETLPTLEETLSAPRASTDREVEMAVSMLPGSEWNYSGGSYLILELLIEEVSGMTFEEYMQQEIFEPLAMSRSGYAYIGDIENNAGSYDRNGNSAPLYQYASSGATAFSTSSADLTKFVLAQLSQHAAGGVLDSSTVQQMREPHGRTAGIDVWGLGTILYAPSANGDFVFGHDGGNDPAINSTARINPDNGNAIIVLETGHLSLATNIGSEWVLWQTGYPDVLDSDAVIASMILPAALGILLLLFALIYFCYRRHRQAHSE